jgi:hypothetical protein
VETAGKRRSSASLILLPTLRLRWTRQVRVRAVLDVVLTGEEDVVSYWDLLVRLWRRYNLTLVVADGVKALDEAISRSGIQVARQAPTRSGALPSFLPSTSRTSRPRSRT